VDIKKKIVQMKMCIFVNLDLYVFFGLS